MSEKTLREAAREALVAMEHARDWLDPEQSAWLDCDNAIESLSAALAVPDVWRPEFDANTVEQYQLAIKYCMEIAGPRGKSGSPPDPVRLLEMAQSLYEAERVNLSDLTELVKPVAVKPLTDEPVAWQITYRRVGGSCGRVLAGHNAVGDYLEIDPNAVSVPLYAAPQSALIKPFKPLTDGHLTKLFDYKKGFTTFETYCDFARAIEAAHGIHGTKK